MEGDLHKRVGMELDYERPEYWTCVSNLEQALMHAEFARQIYTALCGSQEEP